MQRQLYHECAIVDLIEHDGWIGHIARSLIRRGADLSKARWNAELRWNSWPYSPSREVSRLRGP